MTEQLNESSLSEWSAKMGAEQIIPAQIQATPAVFVPAISVVNGSKDSVLFLKVSDQFRVTAQDAAAIESAMVEKLKGSSLEGCKVFVVCGADVRIVNAESLEVRPAETYETMDDLGEQEEIDHERGADDE